MTIAAGIELPEAGIVEICCRHKVRELSLFGSAARGEMWPDSDVDLLVDVGVSGAHRLFAETERLQRADVLVVVAGMEGALPSLVGGLVGVPLLAVPTSVGYGAAFDGLAALLAMLNSCAVGVAVVNIDNGFGAGALAARILAAGRRGAGDGSAGP